MFQLVTEANIHAAAEIHAESWRESHRSFCSPAFIEAHTTETQIDYIRKELSQGKVFYLLYSDSPKGIVSLLENRIENLYVHPSQQRKGYGTQLLHYIEGLCCDNPTLWVLSNNHAAISFYRREGYEFPGNRRELRSDLAELEMKHVIFSGSVSPDGEKHRIKEENPA